MAILGLSIYSANAVKKMKEDEKFSEHFREGLKRFQSGKFAESLEEFFSAAQIDPSSSELHFYIGEALDKHRQQAAGHPTGKATRSTRSNRRFTQATEPAKKSAEEKDSVKDSERSEGRHQAQIPIIVVAYDNNGKFFAELAMTKVTSVKGACIDLGRRLKAGAQLMIFTIDGRNAVPALVRNVRLDENRARYSIGVEFLKGPVDWLVPA